MVSYAQITLKCVGGWGSTRTPPREFTTLSNPKLD